MAKAESKADKASEVSAPTLFLGPAYQMYVTKQVRHDLILPSLRILAAYLGSKGPSREPEALYAAALYIAFRHPNTYPNLVPRSYFASRRSKPSTNRQPATQLFDNPFRAKDSSIDWYVKRIIEKLGIIVLYDERGLPYFLERNGPIYKLIDALAEEVAIDAILMSYVRNRRELLEPVVNGLLDRIINTLRLIPVIFRPSLYEQLASHVESLMENTKWALGL